MRCSTPITILGLSFMAAAVISCSNEKINHASANNVLKAADSSGMFIYYQRGPIIEERRPFTVIVTPGSVYLVVEDYEKVVLRDSSLLTRAAYDSFATAIDDLHIKSRVEIKGPACSGGTWEKFTFHPGTSREVRGWFNFCGGQLNGGLESNEADIVSAIKLFYAIFPDLFEKIDATTKDD